MPVLRRAVAFAATALVLVPLAASAQAVRDGFRENRLFGPAGRDDGPLSAPIAIGFDVNYYGLFNSDLLVCNNGFVQFNPIAGAACPFSPTNTLATQALTTFGIIAPFWSDLDSRIVTRPDAYLGFGTGMLGARQGFGVTWLNVPGFNAAATPNTFQMILWNYADRAEGDFVLEMNYNSIQRSAAARAGFAADRGVWGENAGLELPGSGSANQLNDGSPNALATNSNVGIAGRWCFDFRGGVYTGQAVCATPLDTSVVPEPATVALTGAGLIALLGGAAARRRRSSVTA